ncbi:hypothetical protein LBMAG47_08700 [Planctomycetia bacterium]|nr:hypothetical protein LBMAG47_08700 [Planctomycetia bacterium]
MKIPSKVRDEYMELGKSFQGTSGMLMKAMQAFTRREARNLLAAGASKPELADGFKQLAADCYEKACREKWMNDYALDLAETVRAAVVSLRAK